jgi:carbonic anhydrase
MSPLILAALVAFSGPDSSVSPSSALVKLTEGNKRFVSGHTRHPRSNPGRRAEVAKTQKPFAVVIGCSDSRVGPELVFDQGLGDLFVVRTAGNLVDDFVMGSAEYAVEHLGARLIVVLGHERCGAVVATLDTFGKSHADDDHEPHDGHISYLLEAIRPAVEMTKGAKNPLEAAIRENVRLMVKKMSTADGPLKARLGKSQIKIVGASYDLDTGAVRYFDK